MFDLYTLMVLIEWNSWHGKEYFTSWHFLLVQHRLLSKKVHQSWLWFKSLITPIVIDSLFVKFGKRLPKSSSSVLKFFHHITHSWFTRDFSYACVKQYFKTTLIGRHVLRQLNLTHISCQHSDTLVESAWFQSTVRFSLELSLGKSLNISTSKFWGKL